MHNLSELNLKTSYHKGHDDIAADFYIPCMSRATAFDRAVGYFRSTIFVIAWPALKDFVARGGRIQVLCSQVLSDEDIDALDTGYAARADENIATRLKTEVSALLGEAELRAPTRILAALVAQGGLELKIAILRARDAKSARGRIFHDKLGIFRDRFGNRVIFKGSMNETWNGLAADGNLESVDVAANWLGARDLERTKSEDTYFQDLWNGTYPGLHVRPFPEVAKEELKRVASPAWEEDLEALLNQNRHPITTDPRGRMLLPHQSNGLASWEANGRRGILAFATGAGKTFTAITAIREALSVHKEPVVVLVPDQTLFQQWHNELVETTSDLNAKLLRAGAGHSRWRDHLQNWTAPGDQPRVTVATMQTARGSDFLDRLHGGMHLFLVADEVHRLGSQQNRLIMPPQSFGPRLGLSATPERYGDAVGTQFLLDFFQGVLEPSYTLQDAIRDKVLTPYFYRPHALHLTDDEVVQWRSASAEISRLFARLRGGDQTPGLAARLQNKLIARARIIKHAAAKVQLAREVMAHHYKAGQRWLVYCDDSDQLAAVTAALTEQGFSPIPYHSLMTGDRAQTLKWLDLRGGILTAIKCLDEGVDVPSVTHALILASSKNPREFVQRRGRVLRRSPGKSLAFIHDAIVLPPETDDASNEENRDDPFTAGEMARAIEFALNADNPAAAADLQQIMARLGLDWRKLGRLGDEDDAE